MKIAVVHNLPSGGAKRSTYELVRELSARGHTLYEFTKSTADLDFCPLRPYVQKTTVDSFDQIRLLQQRIPLLTPYIHVLQQMLNLRCLERLSRNAAESISAGGFDLAFVQDCHFIMKPFELRYLSIPSVFFCRHGIHHRMPDRPNRRSKRSLCQTLKDTYYSPAYSLHRQMLNRAETRNIRSASLVLANSHFTRQLLLQHYGVNASVVHNGVDPEKFKPLPVPRAHYVITVGAVTYRKGYHFLISSLGQIPVPRRPELLVVANTIDPVLDKQLQTLADLCEVKMVVRSVFDDNELVDLYNRAQAFVYSPIMEPFGTVILEAMACGTPVVAVNEGGAPEIVVDGVTGMLASRDQEDFANTLQLVLGDRKLQSRLATAALDQVKQYWTWKRAADDLERAFNSCCGSNPIIQQTLEVSENEVKSVGVRY